MSDRTERCWFMLPLVGFGMVCMACGCSQGNAAQANRDPIKTVAKKDLQPTYIRPMETTSKPTAPAKPTPPVSEPAKDKEKTASKSNDKPPQQLAQADGRDRGNRRGGNGGGGPRPNGGGDNRRGDRQRVEFSGPKAPKGPDDGKDEALSLTDGEDGPPREVLKDKGEGRLPPPGSGAVFTFPTGGGGGFGGAPAETKKFKAAPLPSGLPQWFAERDKDGDGQIGMHEWPADEMEEFFKYDRNGDGFVTADEVLRVLKPAITASSGGSGSTTPTTPENADERQKAFAENILRMYDRNKDGKLDQDELQNTQVLRTVWQQYDANRDNALDLNEIIAYLKSNNRGQGQGSGSGFTGSFRFGGGGPGGGGSGGFNGRQGGFGNQSPEERVRGFIARFDKDNDGKLSAEEYPQFMRPPFAEADANKDGFVDAKEMADAFEKMRSQFGGPGGGGPGRFGGGGFGGGGFNGGGNFGGGFGGRRDRN